MRLGIFGGSFDPVHNGHLALAYACQEHARLDEVWFTPTAIQPLKHRGPRAEAKQRVAMLKLAIETVHLDSNQSRTRPLPHWRVCTLEIDRGGLSYTIDTLRQIHAELPEARLYFLVGADAVHDVPQWREPAEIFRLATPLVVRRAGQSEPSFAALEPLCPRNHQPMRVNMPAVNVSSSEIRRRIAAQEAIDDLVPPAVATYISAQGLYR